MKNVALAIHTPYRTVAAVTMLALLAWTFGLPAWIHTASASNVGTFTNTLTDSDLGVKATSTLQFQLTSGVYENQTLRVTFDPDTALFDLTGLANGDIAITAVSGGTITQVANAGACAGTNGQIYVSSINTTSDYVELTMCTNVGNFIATSTVTSIVIGNTNRITNPNVAGSYIIRLGGTNANSGDTRIAIIDDVTVTAAVDTIFTFSINAVGFGQTVNNDVTTTTGTSTATSVPFGTIAPNTAKLMAQELRVDTNALNGYSVTVQANQTLTAGNGATIDTFVDASSVASTTRWQGPAGTMGNPNTYGHWGITSDDNYVASTSPNKWGNGTTSGEALYQGNFVNNPIEVFYHNAAVTSAGGGMGVGSTTVAYKVEIKELQEAAKDYTATLTYIATPVF
jgi:hypothetical protein